LIPAEMVEVSTKRSGLRVQPAKRAAGR
jgi:hypothetical protein